MKKDIYIKKHLVAHKDLGELDLDFKDSFGFNWACNNNFTEIDVITNPKLRNGYFVDTTPIGIDVLQHVIDEFREKGVTHIQMLHHADHHGYELSGFKVELASQELINKYNAEYDKRLKLIKEETKLVNELSDIRKQINALKI